MYYVYFPEESIQVESIIHSIMRHPVYSAMVRISLGTGCLMGTVDSIALGFVLPIVQYCWLRLFEEKELIERFGDGYRSYIQSTNAILSKFRNLGTFWLFLLSTKTNLER